MISFPIPDFLLWDWLPGVIASVMNQMGSMLGDSIFGWIVFILVFVIGHTFNLLINLLGAYVHTCRLQRGVGEAVFRGGLGKHLRGDTAGRQIDEVVALEIGLAGGTIIIAEGIGDVARFVGARLLAGSGKDGAVGLDGVEVVAQNRAGHVDAVCSICS